MHIRYLVILNHLHGLKNVEMARIFDLCSYTVGTYIRKYKGDGLTNLVPVPKLETPHLLSKEQRQQLVEAVTTHNPDEVGFESRKNWDTILVRDDVLALYPTGKIVLILDNTRIHHVKLLKPFLQKNKERL